MRRLAIALGAILLFGGGGGVVAAQDGGSATSATLETDKPAYDRGQNIRITGEGWPANTVVTVELCGNEARNGTVDCDARSSHSVATLPDGRLLADLKATAPPVACPCVVHVFVPGGVLDVGLRVGIRGVPLEPVTEDTGPLRQLEVVGVRVDGGATLGSLFGAAAPRTLVLEIENSGEVPVDRAAARAGWGRTSDRSNLIDVDDLGALAPGERVTVETPFELSAMSFGSYGVSGRIVGFDDARFSAKTSTYPWGLVAVGVVGLGYLAFVVFSSSSRDGIEPDDAEADPN